MSKNVFTYQDYKPYLQAWIESQPSRGRGLKTKLALAMGCNTAYVTHVLSGTAHLSLEQAERASGVLGHTDEEKSFFLLLLQYSRAGTKTLREFLKRQIDQAVERHFNLKDRLDFQKSLSLEDQATYYSSWHYSAILVSLSIPELQTPSALSQHFGISRNSVKVALDFLTSRGLAATDGGKFRTWPVSIHLGVDSPHLNKHHMNWRVRAMNSLSDERRENLHYSSVISISQADEPKIRAVLVKAIEEVRGIVKNSKEDSVYAYTLDFFRASQFEEP